MYYSCYQRKQFRQINITRLIATQIRVWNNLNFSRLIFDSQSTCVSVSGFDETSLKNTLLVSYRFEKTQLESNVDTHIPGPDLCPKHLEVAAAVPSRMHFGHVLLQEEMLWDWDRSWHEGCNLAGSITFNYHNGDIFSELIHFGSN